VPEPATIGEPDPGVCLALFGSWLASGGRMKDVWLPLSTPKQASPQVSGKIDRNYTALKIHNKLPLKSYQPVNFELVM
jgi:hypothetical protein